MREYSGKQVECMKTNYDASIKAKQFDMGSFVLLFHLPKKNVFGRWHVAWKGPFRVMKKLNESNYVVQRSVRSRSALLDAAQGAQEAGQTAAGCIIRICTASQYINIFR